MTKVEYRPQRGGKFVAPALKPGAVLEVSHREAEHLVSTGAFEYVDKKPEQLEPAAGAAEKPAARKGRKETT